MTDDVYIRDLRSTDLPELLPLLDELGYPVEGDILASRLTDYFARGESALVAEKEGRIVGLLTLHITPVIHRAGAVGRVTNLVVTTPMHGQGVGRALMDEAERRLWEKGCVLIEVTSNMKRVDAHAFYKRLGYEQTSFRFGKARPAGT